jgi:hypothetical protein
MAPHSAYSPDLTPTGLFLFDHVKITLQEAELQSSDKLLDVMM